MWRVVTIFLIFAVQSVAARHELMIITAVWDIPGKRAVSMYEEWSLRFFMQRVPMVIFTSPRLVSRFAAMRAEMCPGCLTVWNTQFERPSAITMFENITDTDWLLQHYIDPENCIHRSYELYAVWIAKAWMLFQVVTDPNLHARYYMWQDIGVFRSESAPAVVEFNVGVLDRIFHDDRANRILMCAQPEDPNLVAGGYIVGNMFAIIRFYFRMYYKVMDKNSMREFWGKDQNLYQEIIAQSPNDFLLYHPHLVANFMPEIDPWFIFPYFISQTRADTIYEMALDVEYMLSPIIY